MSNLFKSLSDYNNSVEKSKTIYSGLLGLLVEGERRVQHPSRNSFVYVRLRDNLSEVIQAFNDKVSPVYDLPVLLERRNNIWYVTGRDIDRYQNWGSSAPFLPKHGSQHSFNRDENTGGDVVPIYPDQFMPLLVYPSGTVGSGNLIVAPYMLQRDSDFIYVGNTGTMDVLGYKPTNNQAILGLVYLDTVSGNPGILIGSGTPFSASITGSSQIYPYIPYPTSTDHEPLYAFRLVSGTSSLTWDNLYNVRQFIGGVGGGSGGGTGSFPTFDPNSVVITDASGNIITDPKALYDLALNLLSFGGDPLGIISTLTDAITFMATDGVSAQNLLFSYGTGVAGRFGAVTGRGTKASPTALQDGDVIARFSGRFHYDSGGTPTATQAEIRLVVDGTPASGDYPTRIEFYTTPDGSSTMTLRMTIKNNGQLILGSYGSGTHTGTPAYNLAVDSSGDVIESELPNFATNSNDIFALSGVGASGFTATIATLPGGAVLTYTPVSGNENTLVPTSTSQTGKQRLYNTTRGTYGLISNSNAGTNTTTLTANIPAGWQVGDTITTISPTVASGQNHVDIEIVSGDLLGKSNVWIWGVIIDSGGTNLLRFHPFETFSISKQFNVFSPATGVAFGGLQAYKLVSNVVTIAWTASGASTASPTLRQVGFVK